jgi:hypothetical protein
MSNSDDPSDDDERDAILAAPLIVDLGSRSRKAVKKLRKGTGKLMLEVDAAIAQVRSSLPESERDKQFVPVLVVCKRKKKKRPAMPPLPFPPFSWLR